jgi:hypothetical protein
MIWNLNADSKVVQKVILTGIIVQNLNSTSKELIIISLKLKLSVYFLTTINSRNKLQKAEMKCFITNICEMLILISHITKLIVQKYINSDFVYAKEAFLHM